MATHTDRRQPVNARHREAVERARAAPSEHVPRLITTHHVRLAHSGGRIGRFNSGLAVLITKSVGTMWAAYLFVLIGLVSLPQAWAAFLRGDRVTGVAWLSQSFLQLVLLPIIIVGQNIISAAQDERAMADHETLTALHSINVRELLLLEQQQRILHLLEDVAPK
jgi:hypothetical protein